MVGACAFLAVWDEGNAMSVHLCTGCYAVGVLLGLAALRIKKIQDVLGPHAKPLEMIARHNEFLDLWLHKSAQCFVMVATIWLVTCLSRGFAMLPVDSLAESCVERDEGMAPWLHLACFSVVTGVFIVLTYCQLHTTSALEMMVDDFCLQFFLHKNVEEAIVDWNIVQALLRRSASTLEPCMLASRTFEIVALLLTGLEVYESKGPLSKNGRCAVLWGFSVFSPFAISLYAFFSAAVVSEKCSRVPSLVNSMVLGTAPDPDTALELDARYFRLVDYLRNSAAGFYLKGVRLTAFMVMKLTYVVGLVTLTLIMHSLQ
jgi:hypothetical protein